jgi:hypothetical protein
MIVGGLIAESLATGAVLDAVTLTVTRIWCAAAGDVDAGQPLTWTFIDFEAADDDVDRLAESLERSLRSAGGWYCDFRSETETFVVFAGRTFRYGRGDASGRTAAAAYATSVGVPTAQLDWPE